MGTLDWAFLQSGKESEKKRKSQVVQCIFTLVWFFQQLERYLKALNLSLVVCDSLFLKTNFIFRELSTFFSFAPRLPCLAGKALVF